MNWPRGVLASVLGVALWTSGCTTLGPTHARSIVAEAEPPTNETQGVHKLLFRLRGTEWREASPRKVASRLFVRKYGHQRSHYVVIKFVSVPPGFLYLTPEQHASAYFGQERRDAIRNRSGPAGEGYTEGERTVAGRVFRTLAGRTTDPVAGLSLVDETLVIYFADDPRRHQGFYVVHWMDFHPPDTAPAGLDDLDGLLSTLQLSR